MRVDFPERVLGHEGVPGKKALCGTKPFNSSV
jgi:hypothetical protein